MKSSIAASLLALACAAIGPLAHAEEPKTETPAAEETKTEEPAAEKPKTEAPAGETKLVIGVVPAVMQFDKKAFTVKAGEKVRILFTNKACVFPHNLIILKPGTDAKFGAAADKMVAADAAAAMAKCYIPDDAENKAAIVAASTKLINAGQNEEIKFTAPAEPGEYPYICTYPSHRFLMKGVMTVTK